MVHNLGWKNFDNVIRAKCVNRGLLYLDTRTACVKYDMNGKRVNKCVRTFFQSPWVSQGVWSFFQCILRFVAAREQEKVIQVVDVVEMKEGVEGSAAASSSSSSTSLQPSSSGPPTIENHQPTVEHHHPTVDHQPLPQLRYQKALRPEERQGNLPDEQRLLNYIMRGYEKSVRPVRNASTPVVIRMGLTLTQIFDMVRSLII